jgi:hypothetical protein
MPVKANSEGLEPGSRCPKCTEGKLTGPIYTRHDHDRTSAIAGAGIPNHDGLAYDCNVCGWRGLIVPCKDGESK